jgi:hypothetical protein
MGERIGRSPGNTRTPGTPGTPWGSSNAARPNASPRRARPRDTGPVGSFGYTARMPHPATLPAALEWGRRWAGTQLRNGTWAVAALVAVTLVVVGRGFDLFAFTPDPTRAGTLGLQTGALVGSCWAALLPSPLAALRDPDDGSSAMVRSSVAGAGGLWWGAWGAQITLGLALTSISMLSTSVFSMLMGVPGPALFLSAGTAFGAVVLTGLMASAAAAWGGGVPGALVGMATFLAGQAGTDPWVSAWGPAPVGGPVPALAALRMGVLGVGAVAVTTAGLRRLRR